VRRGVGGNTRGARQHAKDRREGAQRTTEPPGGREVELAADDSAGIAN
jgi:hypothetical protein